MNTDRKLKGSVTIEASLALSLFIIGFATILSLAGVVRAQRALQHGIDQTALEISAYCYAADKAGMTSAVSASSMSFGDAVDRMTGLSGDETGDSSEASDIISAVSRIMLGDRADESVNGPAADGICRALVTKYISDDRISADSYLERLCGISLGDINFRHSAFLRDGKTIKIVAVYKVDLDPFGILPGKGFEISLKNSASTRAWIPEPLESAEPDQQDEEKDVLSSKWLIEGNDPRGKALKSLVCSENPGHVVMPGKGIDLYFRSENVMKEIFSMDIFKSTYTTCSVPDSTDPDDYSLKGNAASVKIKNYAEHIIKSYGKLKGELKMEDGSAADIPKKKPSLAVVIIMPEETEKNKEIMNMLASAADQIKKEKNVAVEYQFREKTLFTAEERQKGKELLCGKSPEE